MELLQLKYFVESIKTLNFSHTAKRFSVPPSAVSQSIKRLESELGTTLFDRSNNKIVPTESGRIFYNQVHIALNAIDRGLHEISLANSAVSGKFSLLVETNRHFIIETLTGFKKTYPHLEFNVVHRRPEKLTYNNYDFIISDVNINSSAFEGIPIIRERIFLAVPKSHYLANETGVALPQLQNEPFISMPPGASLHNILLDIFRKTPFVPNITIYCDDPNYIRLYTSLGFGVTLFPEFSWKNHISDDIKLVPFNTLAPHRITWLYYKKTRANNDIINLFKEFLIINLDMNHPDNSAPKK